MELHPGLVTFIVVSSITSATGVLTWTVESFPFKEHPFWSLIPIWYWNPGVIFIEPPPGRLLASPWLNVCVPKVGFDLPISVPLELYIIYVNWPVPPLPLAIISLSQIDDIVRANAPGAVIVTKGESASQLFDTVVSK